MKDRELIELAARAGGYKVIHSFENNDSLMIEVSERKYEVFNPLTSDADTFRLAVKLRLKVWGVTADGSESACLMPIDGQVIEPVIGGNELDEYEATRRAITRAAAEIGRGMV